MRRIAAETGGQQAFRQTRARHGIVNVLLTVIATSPFLPHRGPYCAGTIIMQCADALR
jgi:hypothetical protein